MTQRTDARVQCVICGRWLRKAGRHYVSAHGIDAAEYRITYAAESSPRPDTCAHGHAMDDALLIPSSGLRQCRTCKIADEARRLHTDPEYAQRKRARQRRYNGQPDVRARMHAHYQTPEYRAANAERQRQRRARLLAEQDS
jgi:hypothetical protein